jgi:hypothetical protein
MTTVLPMISPSGKDSPPDFLPDLLRRIAEAAAGEPFDLALTIRGRRIEVRSSEPDAVPDAPSPRPVRFVPTGFQDDILAILVGKALRTDALVAILGCERSQFFRRPGGIQELRENGLVDNHERLGYYRPDAPPAVLSDVEAAPLPAPASSRRST